MALRGQVATKLKIRPYLEIQLTGITGILYEWNRMKIKLSFSLH